MIAGVILAGGRSRRFGREKAMAVWNGSPLIAHVSQVLAVCDGLAVNARADSGAADWARGAGFPVLEDPDEAPDGPLSGVWAGLSWAYSLGAEILATAPCDTPRLPHDLVAQLATKLGEVGAAAARTPDGLQPLCALWRVSAALPVLRTALEAGDHPPVRDVLAALDAAHVLFEDGALFANVNQPADLKLRKDPP